MIKKIFGGLIAAVILIALIGAYVIHSNNQRIKYETIEQNHIKIVNQIVRDAKIDTEAIQTMRQDIADLSEFKAYDDVLSQFLTLAAKAPDACPVTITVRPKSMGGDAWNASVSMTNTNDKTVDKIDFQIVADNPSGTTISCSQKTKCRWTNLKPGATANCGYWTIHLEPEMNISTFRAADVYIEFTDGTIWSGLPECQQQLPQLKAAFEQAIEKVK